MLGNFDGIGKILILTGIVLVVAGILFIFWDKLPFSGKLPGDIFIEKGNTRFMFPIASCLILSLILTILLNVIGRLFR